MEEPSSVAAADLGPSVIPEFAEAVGLDQKVGRGKRAAQEPMAPGPAAPTPPPPPELPLEMLQATLVQIDAAASEFVGVAPEEEVFMVKLAASVHPLACYYTARANPLVALWTTAALGIAGYAIVKWKKVKALEEQPPGKPNE